MQTNEPRERKQLEKIYKIIDKYADKDFLREYIKKEYINEDGTAVIHIRLYEGLNLYEGMSYGDQLELNPDIYKFIDSKAKIIPAHIPIKLVFNGRKLEKEEQEKIKYLIDEHYAIELFNQQKDIRITRKKVRRLFAIGVGIFILCFYLSGFGKYNFLTDILRIVGTFSLWELTNMALLRKKDIDMQTLHIAKMLIHEFEFKE